MRVIVPTTLSNTEGSYSRSGTATVINSNGLVQTVAANTIRSTYDPDSLQFAGNLLESQSQNLIQYSNEFSSWTNTLMNVTSNTSATVSPDGTNNADIITMTAGGGTVNQVTTTISGSYLTCSIHAKRNNCDYVYINVNDVVVCWFNLATGVVGTNTGGSVAVTFYNKSIKKYPNEWYRCILTVQVSGITTATVKFSTGNTNGNTGIPGNSCYVYGFQGEPLSYATSYIPSTNNYPIRAADVFTGTSASLYYSNVAENDYSAWNAATNYNIGDLVIRTQTHTVYECLIAGVNATPPEDTVDLTVPRWAEVSSTNRWKLLDPYRSTPTTATGTLTFAVAPKIRIDSAALIGLTGVRYVGISMIRQQTGEVVYNQTFNLNYRTTIGWYDYYFDPLATAPGMVTFDLPPYTDGILVITLVGAEEVTCGGCVFGMSKNLGITQRGATNDVLNFSTVNRDIFGNAEMVRRRNVPKTTQTVYADKSLLSQIIKVREDLNAVPALWCGLDDSQADAYFDALLILGFYRNFSINIDNPIGVIVSLELEEL